MTATDPSEGEIDLELQARLDRLAARRSPPGDRQTTASPRPAGRRRHPAARTRLAALGLSLATTGGLGVYFASGGASPAAGDLVQSAQVVALGPAAAVTPSNGIAAPTTTTLASAVDGAVYSNRWGDVQVRATFASDGSLADVVVLQSPDVDSKSVRINDRAVPQLNSEALSAQSADVDTVSGATYTSNDYERSLQSAIDAARSAGLSGLA